MGPPPPHVFWLFGLSGAGKSTLAGSLADGLRSRGLPILSLDGDRLRSGLCAGLGFTDDDRAENLRRAALVARLALESKLSVVAAFITPLQSHRDLVAGILPRGQFSMIYLDATLEVCQQRDVKGLYAGAREGKVSQMTGVGASFDAPHRADLTIATGSEPVEASSASLIRFALSKLAQRSD